ncbi:MAG: DUF11 domain-containing protein [Saprospiraceae bacterium]|nr:DUF11 domain-containing protein [Saprospiraceae bacterium]
MTDSVVNIATAQGTNPAGTPVMSTPDTAYTTVTYMASISLEKTASTPSVVLGADNLLSDGGDQIEYTFFVTNTGNTTLNNVVVQDNGPSFNGIAGENNPLTVTCLAVSLAPGESTECTSVYTMTQTDVDNAAGILNGIRNGAIVMAVSPDDLTISSPVDSAYTSIPNGPGLTIEKTVTGPSIDLGLDPTAVDAGDTIGYDFIVTNNGNVTITNMSVIDAGPTFNLQPAG